MGFFASVSTAGGGFYESDLPHFEGDAIRHIKRLDRWQSLAVRGEIDAAEHQSLNSGLLALIRMEYQLHKKDGTEELYARDIKASGILDRIQSTGVEISNGLEVEKESDEPIASTVAQRIKDYKALREDISVGEEEYEALVSSLSSLVRISYLSAKAKGKEENFMKTLKETGGLEALNKEGISTHQLFDFGPPKPMSFTEKTRLALLEYDLLQQVGKISQVERESLIKARFQLVQVHILTLGKSGSIKELLNELEKNGSLDTFRGAGLNISSLHRPDRVERHPPTFDGIGNQNIHTDDFR